MNIKQTKDAIETIKKSTPSILIFLSLLILPILYKNWLEFYPHKWLLVLITILWLLACILLWIDAYWHRKKTLLFNYLQKEKRHSLKHLTEEWIAKDQYSKKTIHKLIKKFPDVFKYTKVRSNGLDLDGVGIVNSSQNQ